MKERQYWDGLYHIRRENSVGWFQSYKHHIPANSKVLDLGCGSGELSFAISQLGHVVTCVDFSPHAIEMTNELVPDAECFVHDLRDPLPLDDSSFDAVVASLSLHYFPFEELLRITDEIRRVLRWNGLLIFRMNSISDDAANHRGEIARYFYSENDIRKWMDGWSLLFLEKKTLTYYDKPKVLWEGISKLKEIKR